MKKLAVIILAAVMVLSLAACGGNKKEDASTPAGKLMSAFYDEVKADPNASVMDIADKLSQNEVMEFMPMVMPVEEGWMNGFTEDITGFKEACYFGPAISTIPFVGYVFELEDGQDTAAFIKNLESKADLAWNVCTSADEMKSGASGQKVCFIMSKKNFDE